MAGECGVVVADLDKRRKAVEQENDDIWVRDALARLAGLEEEILSLRSDLVGLLHARRSREAGPSTRVTQLRSDQDER